MGSASIAISADSGQDAGLRTGADLTVVVPTFNEAANVGQLARLL